MNRLCASRTSLPRASVALAITCVCILGIAGCHSMEPADPGGTPPTITLERIAGPNVPDAFEAVVYEVRGADPEFGRVVHVSLAVDGTVIARARDQRTTFLRVEVDLGEHWRAHKTSLTIEARAWIDDDLERWTTADLPVQRDGLIGAEVAIERPVDGGIHVSMPETSTLFEAALSRGNSGFGQRRPVSIEFEVQDSAGRTVVSSLVPSTPYELEIESLPYGDYTVRARWVAEEDGTVHEGPYTAPVGFTALDGTLGASIDEDAMRPALSMLGVRRARVLDRWAFRRDGRYTIHDRDLTRTGEVLDPEESYQNWSLDAEGRVVVARVQRSGPRLWIGFRWSDPLGGAFEGETRISLPVTESWRYEEWVQALCPTVDERVAVGLDGTGVEDATPLALFGPGEGVVWRWDQPRTRVRSIVYDAADSALVFLAQQSWPTSRRHVVRVDARTGVEQWDRTIPGARSLRVAPDGRYLIIQGDEEIAWLDRDGGGSTTSWPDLPWDIERVAVHADGHLLVLGSRTTFAEGTRRAFRVLDPAGAVVRERSFESPPTIVEVEDTEAGWLIVGRVDDDRVSRAVVLEVDRDGNVLSSAN